LHSNGSQQPGGGFDRLADLPSSLENEFYLMRLTAGSDDLLLGRLETYGINGGRGRDYRFRVD